MTYREDYEMLVKMIDNTQKQIEKNTKDRLQLIAELELLQQDLKEMRAIRRTTMRTERRNKQ